MRPERCDRSGAVVPTGVRRISLSRAGSGDPAKIAKVVSRVGVRSRLGAERAGDTARHRGTVGPAAICSRWSRRVGASSARPTVGRVGRPFTVRSRRTAGLHRRPRRPPGGESLDRLKSRQLSVASKTEFVADARTTRDRQFRTD